MENIIKKAIEGKYKFNNKEIIYEPVYKHIVALSSQDNGDIVSFGLIVLDPLFWQALGKACGWEMEKIYTGEFSSFNEPECQAIRFHEINLTQGFDKAVDWLEELIK